MRNYWSLTVALVILPVYLVLGLCEGVLAWGEEVVRAIRACRRSTS